MTDVAIEPDPDRVRMQRDRMVRLHGAMADQDIGALVLLGNTNVSYATGTRWTLSDPGRANVERPVAVVTVDDSRPHVFTPYPEDAEGLDLSADHLHGPVYLDFDEGAETFAGILADLAPAGGRVAVDELTGAMQRTGDRLFPSGPPPGADDVIGAAKLTKTNDELGFLRQALSITEQAIATVHEGLAPGVRQVDLTAQFLHRAFELGADANLLDPIFQVMPERLVDGPWTTHGDIACPLVTTERELVEGDVIWVDTSLSYGGFSSDFGRTWVVGQEPSERQREQFTRWCEIMDAVYGVVKAGATGADLTSAATALYDGHRPWMKHFYLGHGLGIDAAESPFIGTDIGEAYDARQVLSPGTVVVLEPLVWEDGACGYRSEEVIVVTDDGWLPLTDYPYDPYGD